MWIDAEDQHSRIVRGDKLDTIYVRYKGSGNYAVIGTIGDRDIHLKTFATEKGAEDWVEELKELID